jgi:biotin carboxylase
MRGIIRRPAGCTAVLHCDSPVLALTSMRLLARRGIPSVLVTSRAANYARHSRYCLEMIVGEGPEPVAEALQRYRPAVLLPLTVEPVMTAAEHHAELAAVGAVPPAPPTASILAVTDKERFAQFAAKTKLPVPRTRPAGDLAEVRAAVVELGLPVVVKPVDGGPKHLVRTWEQLTSVRVDGPHVVQEFIEGDDVDCSLLANAGHVSHALCQTNLRTHESLCGLPVAVRAVESRAARDLACRLARDLSWSGLAHVDMRVDRRRGRLVVFEMNPRLWASHLFAERVAGFDAPYLLYRQALGELAPPLRLPDTATTYVAPRTLLTRPLAAARMVSRIRRPRLYPTLLFGDLSDPLPLVRRAL